MRPLDDIRRDEMTPPQSIEAEKCVLGACLIDRRALEMAEARLKACHFYLEAHRTIYAAMLELYQDGPVDLQTLSIRLRDAGRLDQVGGMSYLMGIADIVPTTANLGYYADIVHEKALRRSTIEAAQDLKNWAYDETIPTADMLSNAEARVNAIAELRGADVPGQEEAMDETREYLNAGRSVRIPFYLKTVSDYMAGGMMPGYFNTIGADPGIGKTRMVVRDIYHQIQAGRSVVFFSLEIPRPEIETELMALYLRVNRETIGCEDDRKSDPFITTTSDPEYLKAEAVMRKWPLRIFDGSIDAEDMEPIVRRLQHKGRVDVVHVDYAGLISVHGKGGAERMEDVSQYLMNLYKRCKVAGVVLCHVTKKNGEVSPWYSRKLEQDCQSFWYIPKPGNEDEKDKGEPVVTLAAMDGRFDFRNQKNRYARRSRDILHVGWDHKFGYFQDLPEGQRGAGM
jgi:replicative DNA helicase